MIIKNGNLCDDNGQPLSCPLQPVMATVQQGIKPKTVFIRQGCVINCTHFEQSGDTVKLLCCNRKFINVITKSTAGGN